MLRRAGLVVAKRVPGKNNIQLKSNQYKIKFFPLFFLIVFSFAINDGVSRLSVYLKAVKSPLNAENHKRQFLAFLAESGEFGFDGNDDFTKLAADARPRHIAQVGWLVHPDQIGSLQNNQCFLQPPRSPPHIIL